MNDDHDDDDDAIIQVCPPPSILRNRRGRHASQVFRLSIPLGACVCASLVSVLTMPVSSYPVIEFQTDNTEPPL